MLLRIVASFSCRRKQFVSVVMTGRRSAGASLPRLTSCFAWSVACSSRQDGGSSIRPSSTAARIVTKSRMHSGFHSSEVARDTGQLWMRAACGI